MYTKHDYLDASVKCILSSVIQNAKLGDVLEICNYPGLPQLNYRVNPQSCT